MKTFIGEGGIFEVSWNKKGDKVAVCFENHLVSRKNNKHNIKLIIHLFIFI